MLERLEGQPHHTPYAVNELEEWYAKQERLQDLNKRILRAGLSRRQEEVLALRRAGYSHADIAAQLGISLGAVKQHAFRGSGKISNADGA
jgi:DNA-directed RNA polymerase specialized sigma24 family protein